MRSAQADHEIVSFRTGRLGRLAPGLPPNRHSRIASPGSSTMIEQDDEEATTPLMVVPDEATPLTGRRRRRLRSGVLATAAAAALMVAAPALDIKKMRRPLAASGAAPTLNRQSLVDPFLKTPHSFKAQLYESNDDDDDDDDDEDEREQDGLPSPGGLPSRSDAGERSEDPSARRRVPVSPRTGKAPCAAVGRRKTSSSSLRPLTHSRVLPVSAH